MRWFFQCFYLYSSYNHRVKHPKPPSPWSSRPWMWTFCVLWRFICVKTCCSFCTLQDTWTLIQVIILKLLVEVRQKLLVVPLGKAVGWSRRFTCTTDHTHLEEKVWHKKPLDSRSKKLRKIYYISEIVCALRLVNLAGRILQYGPLNLKLCFCALYFKIKRYNKYLTYLVSRSVL